MKKQFARVLSFVMALMMVVTTFGTMGIFAETCAHENVTEKIHDPQCNALGFTTVVCNDCNYTWTKDVKAKVECKGETVEAEEATCTTPAYSAGERCIWCDEIISGCEVVAPALGHNMAYVTIDASCTDINRIEHACTRCDYNEGALDLEEILGFEIPEAPGHNFVYEIVEEPYCTVRKMKSTELESKGVNKGLPKAEYIGRAFHPISDTGVVSKEWWIVEGHNGKAVYQCTNEACSYDCDRAYIEIVVLWNDSLHNFTNATQTYGKDDCFGAYYEWEECKICGFNNYNTELYDERKPLKFDVQDYITTDEVKHAWHLATDSEALEWGANNPAELKKHGIEALKGAELEATCYEKGYTLKHCDKCNTFNFNVTTQSHDFAIKANTITEEVEPTCLTPGGLRVYCNNGCGAVELKNKEDAWGHDYAFSCEDGCDEGKCYDCTHKNRVGTCIHEYDKPGDDTDEKVLCGAEYKMPENHEHVFTSQLYYYYNFNGEIRDLGKYNGQVSCSVDYYLYKKCECAGKPYHCDATESAGLVPKNPEKGEHTWEIVKMTVKVADCDDDGSFAVACAFCNKRDERDENGDGTYVGAEACQYIIDNYGKGTVAQAEAFDTEYQINFFNTTKKVGTKVTPAHNHNNTNGSTEYDCFIAHGHNYEGQEATCTKFGEIRVCTYCEGTQGHDDVGKLNPNNHDCEQKKFNVPPTCGQRELVITIYGCGAPASVKEQDVVLSALKVLANHKSYLRYEDGKIWKEVKDETTGEITVETLGTTQADLVKVDYVAPKCLEIGNPNYYYCPECRNYLIYDDLDEDGDEITNEFIEVVPRFVLDEENNYVENIHHDRLTANKNGVAVPYLEPTYHVGTVVEVKGVKETCTEIGWTDYAYCTACTENAEVEVLEFERNAFGAACGDDCAQTGDKVIYHYTKTTTDKYQFSTTGIVFVRKTSDGTWVISQTSDKLYRPIPAHGDKYQVTNDEAIDPTCSTAGLEAGTHCKLCCGKYLNPAKNWVAIKDTNSPFYIAPLGHVKPVYDADNDEWTNDHDQWRFEEVEGICDGGNLYCCAEYSYTAVWCKWCYDIDALAWDEVDYEFDANGDYTVPNNGAWFIDNVTTLYEHVWAMTEDEEGNLMLDLEVYGPFCTDEGFKAKVCEYCDCMEIVEVLKPTGHYYMNGEDKVILDTSCKANADEESDTYCLGITCDGCGKNLSEEDITHNWAHVEIPETCTEDGVEFWHCTWCYIYAVEDEDTETLVPAEREEAEQVIDNFDGHKFCSIVEDSYKAPTTKEEGQVQYRCGRCGEVITVYIPMLDGGLDMWLTTEDVYTYANGDTVYVTVNVASMFEESFEFTAMEFYLNYNTALLEFVDYTVNHDDTIATEVAAVPFGNLTEGVINYIGNTNGACDMLMNAAYALGNGKIKVISYATGDSAEIEFEDDAYITLEFKIKGALALNMPAYVEFAPSYDYVVYDAEGEYMDNAWFNAWDYVEFYAELTGDVDRNGKVDIGDMVALNKLAKPGSEYDSVADINKDGIVNVKDVMVLRQFLATERTYVDYCAMMGVDFWAEFAATAEEYLPFFNAVIDVLDQAALASMIEEYESYYDLYFSDMSTGALASVIDSIEGDITVDEVVTIAKILMGLVEFAVPALPMDISAYLYAIPADAVSLVIGLASVLVAGDLLVGLI